MTVQRQKIEQMSVPDVARMLELADWEFKVSTVDTLRHLIDQLDCA